MRPGQAEPWAKGQLPGWGWRHWQGPELDRGLWSHSEESSFCPKNTWKPVEVWTSGRKTTKKKSPFRFSLIHRSHLILSLWSCLHPTVFRFVFHWGRIGIYLKFELPPETPSNPELPHTDTQPIWLIISGVSVAHTQNFSLVSHFHVTSGLPQAQREAVYEKVWAEWREPGITE